MVNKPLFAQIINRRLTELDKSAAWLARQVDVSEATISRWRDEGDTGNIQDNQHVHLLAKHLRLNDAERRAFFAAAGLVWESSVGPPLPLTPTETAYLNHLRQECDKLPFMEDPRESSLRRSERASLANVYIDLQTTLPPTFDQVCDRLGVPERERQGLRSAFGSLDRTALKLGGDDAILAVFGGPEEIEETERRRETGAVSAKQLRESLFKQWAKDDDAMQQALRTQTALEALRTHPQLVLLGDPGSGKSTLVNHLAHVLAGALLDKEPEWSAMLEGRFQLPLFPLRIVTRRWSGSLSDGAAAGVDRAYEALQALPGGMDRARLVERLNRPDTLVMFDGLDEVPVAEAEGDYDRRRVLIDSVLAFADAHPDCRILVTSRIRPYQLPGYQLRGWRDATLAKLDAARIKRFVQLWYQEVRRVEGALAAKETEWRGRLQRAIDVRRDLREMAEIPLLLTMLALVNKRAGLPENRAELYDVCTNQLLWEWEKVKADEGKTPSLYHLLEETEPRRKSQDVEKVLWRLTFEAHRKSGARIADLPEDELRKALATLPPKRADNWAWADRVIEFMRQRSGLLIHVADGTFTFPHRSFQEYLAARHLLELEHFEREAVNLAADENWREVISLACGHLAVTTRDRDWRSLVGELAFAINKDPQCWQAAVLAGLAWLEYGPERVEGFVGAQLNEDLPPILTSIMQDPGIPAPSRLEAGLILADLSVLPDDLDALIPLPAGRLDYPCRIGKYPVTNTQYARFMREGGYNADKSWWTKAAVADIESWASNKDWRNGPRYQDEPTLNKATQPVVGVSWYEAAAYCHWLTNRWREEGVISPDESLRLPTAQEWDAAAGTGLREYAWEGEFDLSRCNSRESAFGQSSPVHMYPAGATPEGVYDLCGNVWEWSQDDDTELEGTKRLRGGAWWNEAEGVTTSAADWNLPRFRGYSIGFRVVVVPNSRVP